MSKFEKYLETLNESKEVPEDELKELIDLIKQVKAKINSDNYEQIDEYINKFDGPIYKELDDIFSGGKLFTNEIIVALNRGYEKEGTEQRTAALAIISSLQKALRKIK